MITTVKIEKEIEDLHNTHTTIMSMIFELEAMIDSIYNDIKDDTIEEYQVRNRVQRKIEDIDTVTHSLKLALYDAQGRASGVEQEIYREAYKNKVIE